MATLPSYELHTLGWKAFQDLCVAIAAESLGRPIQMFLASRDGGRDGAFVGTRKDGSATGKSTIQCKFTSLPHEHLTASMLDDEVSKVKRLVSQGLANDYIIVTNHPVSGTSESQIRQMFLVAGVVECTVLGRDWIVGEISKSPRLRMLVPRLYGLGDLSQILDERAYEQASMILSSMGDDLKKLVVTDAHRRSVEAISKHNFVLLLGAPASGKSTIGASLAVGAADIWKSLTVRATSPEQVERHLNPNEKQFIWIDDAWGSTQYQKDTAEGWNRILPLIHAATRRGTRFLLTSRDYIWVQAKRDLKAHALPLLNYSQVVINVQALATGEKAQILYNHLRMGDQPQAFRTAIKEFLPGIAEGGDFLPETARRLGSRFFSDTLVPAKSTVEKFFSEPEQFLLDTISNLSGDCLGAVALIYLSGSTVPSPVPDGAAMRDVCSAFGVVGAQVKDALNAMNGSLVLLAHNEQGRYWTYKHPTIGDAFSSYVAVNPEFLTYFLRGAKPEAIMQEVVCGAVELQNARVRVLPDNYDLLFQRLKSVPRWQLQTFLSYRADKAFAQLLIERRPDLLSNITTFFTPIAQDQDASLLCRLHELGLLPEDLRLDFYFQLKKAALEEADASFLMDPSIAKIITKAERSDILRSVNAIVLNNLPRLIAEVRSKWGKDTSPQDHFSDFEVSIKEFAKAIMKADQAIKLFEELSYQLKSMVCEMEEEYSETPSVESPVSAKGRMESSLSGLFRDVDA